MPEGPEVKLSAELIRPLIVNHAIIDAYFTKNSRYASDKPEGYLVFMENLKGGSCLVKDVQVKGKFMYWTFSNDWYMFCTFGMTGQWSLYGGKHPCFVFHHVEDIRTLQTYQEMYFNDPRHFGTIKFTNDAKELKDKLNELGWDPFSGELSDYQEYLISCIKRSDLPICQILLDQTLFSGVGNYIRAEALYISKISPWRIGRDMSRDDILPLCQAIIAVMQESYNYQGATIHTYKTAYGEEGRYSSCFKVYGRNFDPDGKPIVSKSFKNRTIHWCPQIQI
jgi:formamidopyrimidine-DNA glycosylase